MESFHEFRKLWGRIETDVEPGMYQMEINNSSFFLLRF
jgi:hypothetical protein